MSHHTPTSVPVRAVTRWRKKPVVIEAMQLDGTAEQAMAVCKWVHEGGGRVMALSTNTGADLFYDLSIRTLEGDMRADPGDWIIRGVKGEFYPCKPDVFAASYEPCDARPSEEGSSDG